MSLLKEASSSECRSKKLLSFTALIWAESQTRVVLRATQGKPTTVANSARSRKRLLPLMRREITLGERRTLGLKQLLARQQLRRMQIKFRVCNHSSKNYESQVTGLQNQYTAALGQIQTWQGKAGEYQKQASNWEDQFNKRTSEWEAARDEASMYREQAVGQQLRALRSGAAAGGAGSSSGPGGNLTSGRTGYSSADDKAVQIEKNIKAESGALQRKGNVVELIRRNVSPSTGSGQAQARGVNPGWFWKLLRISFRLKNG